MPRSTPITRPVTTAETPGWLDIDAEGSVDADAPTRVAGTTSTPCPAIITWTSSPMAKPVLALVTGPDLSGERVGESVGGRPGRGGAADGRKEGERSAGELNHGFHAAGSLTNAVPARGRQSFARMRPAARRGLWTTFPRL